VDSASGHYLGGAARTFVALYICVTERIIRFVAASLASHGETKLRDAPDADRQNDHRPGQCGGQQCDGNRNSPARREELDTHVARVLDNEIKERYAKEHRDGGRDPRRRRSRVTKAIVALRASLAMRRRLLVVSIVTRWNSAGVLTRCVIGVAHDENTKRKKQSLVEVMGFEPTASTLRT
jgi:hypothetical protein